MSLQMALHSFNLRMLAEDLVRVRRPDDRERYAASQRQARIDPNPHQIDAAPLSDCRVDLPAGGPSGGGRDGGEGKAISKDSDHEFVRAVGLERAIQRW